MILKKMYEDIPFREKEILRYAGCKEADQETESLIKQCISEVEKKLKYQVCYCELPVRIEGDHCDFDVLKIRSENLAYNLENCKKVILFAATIGVEIDRLITKYGRISPAKALIFQAIGAERIEALSDLFCQELSGRPRFSPGYGDFPLSAQKDLFNILSPERHIGLTLTDSMLMSPSKSVTAFVGLTDGAQIGKINKCSSCKKHDCIYRGVL